MSRLQSSEKQEVLEELTALLDRNDLPINWAARRLGKSGQHLRAVIKGAQKPGMGLFNEIVSLVDTLKFLDRRRVS